MQQTENNTENTTEKSTEHKTNNRVTLIAFLTLFTLPVALAWIAYFSGWYDELDSTNKGQWVKPVLMFEEFSPVYGSDGQAVVIMPGETWKLVYPALVQDCQDNSGDSICHLNLFLIGQVHLALGKESNRMERQMFNGTAKYTEAQYNAVTQRFLGLRVVNSNFESTDLLSSDYVYIIDPVGNIILKYPIVKSKDAVPLKGKDILSDLRKLMKLSRIG